MVAATPAAAVPGRFLKVVVVVVIVVVVVVVVVVVGAVVQLQGGIRVDVDVLPRRGRVEQVRDAIGGAGWRGRAPIVVRCWGCHGRAVAGLLVPARSRPSVVRDTR